MFTETVLPLMYLAKATRRGGKLITVGRGPSTHNVSLNVASSREIDILGCFRYCNL